MAPTVSQIISSNQELAKESGLIRPVAVLLGGTSGIGAGTARALTSTFNGNIHLILSSRSEKSAQAVIDSIPFPIKSTKDIVGEKSSINTTVVDFIQSDATDVKSIKSLAEKIEALGVDKVNYLVLSCGQLTLNGSERTKDGVERKLAMNFYSRFALAYHLLPLLRKASSLSEPAKVMSILAPSRGGQIDVDDLGLLEESKRSGQSPLWRGQWLRSAEKAGVTYNDLMTEGFAKMNLNENLSFIHAFPGFVKTPMLKNFNLPIRLLFAPLVALGVDENDSGQFMLNALLRNDTKNGDHYVDPKGQNFTKERAPATWDGAELGTPERSHIIEKLFNHLKQVAGLE